MEINKNVSIGLMGAVFMSANKGCEALGFSFLSILSNIAVKHNLYIELYIFTRFSYKTYFRWVLDKNFRKRVLPIIQYSNIKYHLAPENQDVGKWLMNKLIEKCDLVFDFTGGDSFSDLYGKERFYKNLKYKNWVLEHNVPLILGSQTYGPFNEGDTREAARKLLTLVNKIYARDAISAQYIQEICGCEVKTVTDVAFCLPYEKMSEIRTDKIRVGINVSGLLWGGGYTQNNQFNLKTDYKRYCDQIIHYLTELNDIYEVYLVPHVFSTSRKGSYIVDDDLAPCKILKERYHNLNMPQYFDTPMEAKSFISNMDIFIGARMHATIAAFSSYVATIPFSYSRKFEGLYGDFNYPYLISGTLLSTEEAINRTINYIKDYKKISKNVIEIMNGIVKKRMKIFEDEIEKILIEMK